LFKQIWPLLQSLAIRQLPGMQPPLMQRWSAPYADWQALSLMHVTHVREPKSHIFPAGQSWWTRQSPTMQVPLTHAWPSPQLAWLLHGPQAPATQIKPFGQSTRD
jgi:hypothetical protein